MPLARARLVALIATLATTAACLKNTVEDLRPSSSGAGGSTASGGDTPPAYDGVVMTWADALSKTDFSGSGSTSSGGVPGGPAPTDWLVTVGKNAKLTCDASPFAPESCPGWSVSFLLPPEFQKVGKLPLSTEALHASHSVEGHNIDDPMGSCFGGGGSFVEGTLEFLSFDNGVVRFRIDGAPTFGFDANGEHSAALCSGITPPVPEVTRALAFREKAIPPLDPTPSGNTGTTAATGGGPDPNDLQLFFTDPSGARKLACSTSPFQDTCPMPSWMVSLTLPVALQSPGLYSLAELNAFASETDASSTPNDCSGGGGSFSEGTLEVLAIDANSISVKLTGKAFAGPGAIDETFSMAICN